MNIILIATTYSEELYPYDLEGEEETLKKIKFVLENNNDIQSLNIIIPNTFFGIEQAIEINNYSYWVHNHKLKKIEKWITTKECKKLFNKQKQLTFKQED